VRKRERVYFIFSTYWLVREMWESIEEEQRQCLIYPILILAGEREVGE
jgi:hypothetical protein